MRLGRPSAPISCSPFCWSFLSTDAHHLTGSVSIWCLFSNWNRADEKMCLDTYLTTTILPRTCVLTWLHRSGCSGDNLSFASTYTNPKLLRWIKGADTELVDCSNHQHRSWLFPSGVYCIDWSWVESFDKVLVWTKYRKATVVTLL